MSNVAIDRFGEVLMTRVRDESIDKWKSIVRGQMATSDEAAAKLVRLEPNAKRIFVSLLPHVVDTVIHNLLWTLEQSQEISVRVKAGRATVQSVAEVSDGLCGELYGTKGWISRFSKEK